MSHQSHEDPEENASRKAARNERKGAKAILKFDSSSLSFLFLIMKTRIIVKGIMVPAIDRAFAFFPILLAPLR